MKIAVISDSHDNKDNLQRAAKIANQRQCDWLFHLGDMVSPFTAERLKNFKGQVKGVFGNCDGERFGLQRVFNTMGGEIQSPPVSFQLADKRFILMHEPYLLDDVVKAQEADFIFYGHLHKIDRRTIGRTHILNPGEAAGLMRLPTFFIVDVQACHFEQVDL